MLCLQNCELNFFFFFFSFAFLWNGSSHGRRFPLFSRMPDAKILFSYFWGPCGALEYCQNKALGSFFVFLGLSSFFFFTWNYCYYYIFSFTWDYFFFTNGEGLWDVVKCSQNCFGRALLVLVSDRLTFFSMFLLQSRSGSNEIEGTTK